MKIVIKRADVVNKFDERSGLTAREENERKSGSALIAVVSWPHEQLYRRSVVSEGGRGISFAFLHPPSPFLVSSADRRIFPCDSRDGRRTESTFVKSDPLITPRRVD